MALQVLEQHLPANDTALPAANDLDVTSEVPGTAPAPVAARVSGEVESRDDVLRSLDRILAYYARHEPSSPLPVLLTRARGLVQADFAAIVRNLIPDGLSQFEHLRGPDLD